MLRPATVTRLAPAKINLALRVIGRRPDGYHELQSVFLPLDWGDTVRVRVEATKGRAVECETRPDGGLSGPDNLAARAARAYLDARGLDAQVTISIEKRIWTAAGLGGGSSDAAAVLRALAALDPTPPSADDLARLALSLGADVPFFLDPRPARITGVGDIRAPLAIPALDVLLANPGRAVSTRDVFLRLGLAPGEAHEQPGALRPALPAELLDAADAARWVENDLEPAALALCPAIGELRRALEGAGALATGLSGSGPTLFGLFPSAEASDRAARELSEKSKWFLAPCRSLGARRPA